MPVIRRQIRHFVDIWNVHRIRKQKNRPSVVHGQPWVNYNYPKEPAIQQGKKPDPELVRRLKEDISSWGKSFESKHA